jgi:hypothetical protein
MNFTKTASKVRPISLTFCGIDASSSVLHKEQPFLSQRHLLVEEINWLQEILRLITALTKAYNWNLC